MRIVVIADIHGNLAALQAVLADARLHGGIDVLWCLGDLVGYGPQPGDCIETIGGLNAVVIAGNHDRGAIGKLNTSYFNPAAAEVLQWTAEQLTPAQADYLGRLPLIMEYEQFLLVHGSPSDPLLEYILSAGIAERNFDLHAFKYCMAGHSHIPVAFRNENDGGKPIGLQPGVGLVLGDRRMIVNPGSVGQPRDGDPRASYGVYDTEANMFRLQRVEYDIQATQDAMMAAGLPIRLITRLGQGR